MNIKKSIIAAGTVGALGLGTLAGIHATRAASPDTNPMSGLVSAIAQKFNLNQDEVQEVFNEHHQQIKTDHQEAMKDRLAQAVTDGKITQEQADLLTAKHAELKASMESLQGKTMEERHEAMKTQMDELKTWAEENNIPLENLHIGMKGRTGGHRGMFQHRLDQ